MKTFLPLKVIGTNRGVPASARINVKTVISISINSTSTGMFYVNIQTLPSISPYFTPTTASYTKPQIDELVNALVSEDFLILPPVGVSTTTTYVNPDAIEGVYTTDDNTFQEFVMTNSEGTVDWGNIPVVNNYVSNHII